jgi:hypothetical protein
MNKWPFFSFIANNAILCSSEYDKLYINDPDMKAAKAAEMKLRFKYIEAAAGSKWR